MPRDRRERGERVVTVVRIGERDPFMRAARPIVERPSLAFLGEQESYAGFPYVGRPLRRVLQTRHNVRGKKCCLSGNSARKIIRRKTREAYKASIKGLLAPYVLYRTIDRSLMLFHGV
jgi:hypothetical protein